MSMFELRLPLGDVSNDRGGIHFLFGEFGAALIYHLKVE